MTWAVMTLEAKVDLAIIATPIHTVLDIVSGHRSIKTILPKELSVQSGYDLKVRTTNEGDRIMWKKKEEKKAEKEESLLKELCGDDAKLYDFLSNCLYLNPSTAIPQKDLDILTAEADKSGNYRPAVDKAIFEAALNEEERERYIKVIQNLASKIIRTTEKEKEKIEKEEFTGQVASLERRIKNNEFMSERAEDIINVASKFYNEKLVELEENARREARGGERREADVEARRTEELEKTGREARKKERKEMGREDKKEAKKQDKIEGLAAKKRKETREEMRIETDREEMRIGDREKAGRETRKKERRENQKIGHSNRR